MDDAYLDWALADFSGYIAIDELYDGPFCVLSIVDNRTYKRLAFMVLPHNPRHEQITAFLQRFRKSLEKRQLILHGITTDGSPLYPEPIRMVFGQVPHQICEFHIIKEITKAILRAVAKVRKTLADQKPRLKRGRPSAKAGRKTVRQRRRIAQKIAGLFKSRFLFVQHDLTKAERKTLQGMTRGLPQLQTLRSIMEEVYRLFDRRCRTDTALVKLARLRQRIRRFKALGQLLAKLESPGLEKALVFLDDRLLPSTSNAVERANRRHRKMQKSVYRVRTLERIHNRIALDMVRDSQKEGRTMAVHLLHELRAA
jgi:Transposase